MAGGADGTFLASTCAEAHQQLLALDGGAGPVHLHGAACALRSISAWGQQSSHIPETLAQSPAGVGQVAWSPTRLKTLSP